MTRIASVALVFLSSLFFGLSLQGGTAVQGRVLEVLSDDRALRVEVTEASDTFSVGQVADFRIGLGDLEIGYADRLIRAQAVHYGNAWHLERIFPVDGAGAKALQDLNRRLRAETAALSRRDYVMVGDYVPHFAMIDQDGRFLQIRSLRGNAFVLNFIFTRCAVPEMCPASSTRMAELQNRASEAGLDKLHFVTITLDPEFDSPGILRQYARGYGIETDNFHLLTNTQQVVDDLLRQFGILTRDEDGTINHTMATLLVDKNGRVSFRKEGASWSVDEFLKAAQDLLETSEDEK